MEQRDGILILHNRHAGVEPPLGGRSAEGLLPGVVHVHVELVAHHHIPGKVDQRNEVASDNLVASLLLVMASNLIATNSHGLHRA